jgi:hypothetical protein
MTILRHVPLQFRGSAAIKMVLVSLEGVEYFKFFE